MDSQMLSQLGLGTTRLATYGTAESSQTGIQLYVSYTVLFQGIGPLERFTTVIRQVGTLVVVHIVHVTNVVLLATRLVRTLLAVEPVLIPKHGTVCACMSLQMSLVEKWSGCTVGTLNTPQYLFSCYIFTSLEEHSATL